MGCASPGDTTLFIKIRPDGKAPGSVGGQQVWEDQVKGEVDRSVSVQIRAFNCLAVGHEPGVSWFLRCPELLEISVTTISRHAK